MWYQIERMSDHHGPLYYWSIYRGVDTLVAASLQHWDSAEEASADASWELQETFGRHVTAPLRTIDI